MTSPHRLTRPADPVASMSARTGCCPLPLRGAGLAWMLACGLMLAATGRLPAQQVAAQVLSAKDASAKALLLVKARRQMTAEDVALLIARETDETAVAMAVGMFLQGRVETGQAAELLQRYAARRGQAGRAAVMAACKTDVGALVDVLLAGSNRTGAQLAARTLATGAFLARYNRERPVRTVLPWDQSDLFATPLKARQADEARQGKAGARRKKPPEHKARAAQACGYAPLTAPRLKILLDWRDEQVRELALVAAAYAADASLATVVEAMTGRPGPDEQAARLWYLAAIGRGLDEQAAKTLLRYKPRLDRRFTRLGPDLADYDIQGHGLLYLCRAVACAADRRFLDDMLGLLRHADLRLRIEAADALQAIGDPTAVPALWAQMTDRQPWPVQVALLSAIGAIPDAQSPQKLLAYARRQKGRLRREAYYALASILCSKIPRSDMIEKDWLDKQATFLPDRPATLAWRRRYRVQDIDVPALMMFYDLAIISDRPVFVLDTSLSMRGQQIQDLQRTVMELLEAMPDYVRFNIVDFGGTVSVLKPGSLIDGRLARRALDLVHSMDLTLGTRTYDALEAAARLPGVDTLVYLSDGAPVGGQFSDWQDISDGLAVLNRYRPLVIDCIYYGQGGKNDGARRMLPIAERHSGRVARGG